MSGASWGTSLILAASWLSTWPVIVGFVLLIALLAFLKTPFFKGWFGELAVNLALKLFLDKRSYQLIQDVTIPTTEDGTTQIDHVVVSRYGIFVIETKDRKGSIYGQEREPQWTQCVGKGKYPFQNPLHQNYKHVKVLSELLEMPEGVFHSVVYFVGDAKLKTPMPENVLTSKLVTYIKKHRQEILSDDQVQQVLQRIEEKRLAPGLATHFQHVRHVKQVVAEKNRQREERREARAQPQAQTVRTQPVSGTATPQAQPPTHPAAATANVASLGEQKPPVCQKCGAVMVLRTGSKGAYQGKRFWGCSAFPKCRGIISID